MRKPGISFLQACFLRDIPEVYAQGQNWEIQIRAVAFILIGKNMIDKIRQYLEKPEVQQGLGITGQDFKVDFLGEGKFNVMHLITAGNKKFVLRLNKHIAHEEIDKIRNEFMLLKELEPKGFAPKAFLLDDSKEFFPTSLEILEYIEGQDLSELTITDDILKKVAQIYAGIHKRKFSRFGVYPPTHEPPFSITAELEFHLNINDLTGIRNDPETKGIVADYEAGLNPLLDQMRQKDDYSNITEFSLLKGDNKISNIIVNNDSIRFIDWEFAKSGLAIAELANFISFAGLSEEQTKLFIEAYEKTAETKISMQELNFFKNRDFILRTIWTLRKIAEHHKLGDKAGLLENLRILREKTAKIPKSL